MSGDELPYGAYWASFFLVKMASQVTFLYYYFNNLFIDWFIHWFFLHFYEPKDWGQGHAAILAKNAK